MKNLHYTSICLALFIAGCGGSGGGTSNQQSNNSSLSGTAAVGAAIKDAEVTAQCKNGSNFTASVTTGDDGTWSGKVNSDSLPCVVTVTGGTPEITLRSYATSSGTLNITPLTDLALIIHQKDDGFNWVDDTSLWPNTAALQNTTDGFLEALKENGYAVPEGNPFTTAFAIGDDWDIVLDDLGDASDYADLTEMLKDGDYDKLPLNPNLRLTGDGAALADKAGATGTFNGTTYTFTESTTWTENPLNNSGGFIGTGATTDSFWKIDRLIRKKDMIGKPQFCGTDPASSVSIGLQLPASSLYAASPDISSCTVILTEMSETDSSFKAKFAAKLRTASDSNTTTVVDGYVIHKEVSEPEPTPSDVPATFTVGSVTETYDRVSCVPQDNPARMVVTLSDTVLGDTQIVLNFTGAKTPENGTQYTSTSKRPGLGDTDFRLHIQGIVIKYSWGLFYTGDSTGKVASYTATGSARKFTGANVPTGDNKISFDITCPEEV